MGKRDGVDVHFRKTLRRERERRRWSQADLAKKLTESGVPMYHTTIAKIEAGERAVRVDEAAGLADALEVPLDWMLGRQAAGPANEIRYSLRVLREKAQETMAGIASMIQAIQDWETDTFGIDFAGKDGVDVDFKEAAKALAYVQTLLVEIALCELPEEHPVWQRDLAHHNEVLKRIVDSLPIAPLKEVAPEDFNDIDLGGKQP